MTRAKQRIRADILKRRGLRVGKYSRIEPDVVDRQSMNLSTDPSKTLAMKLIEEALGTDIKEMLASGTLGEVAEMLGVDKSTVSKWRLRLGLRKGNNHDR